MTSRRSDPDSAHRHDKQLQGVALETVLEKRRLDQALNAKEFAVCAGVSYSTARSWFHLPGFPAFHGVVFWQDFVQWRSRHYGNDDLPMSDNGSHTMVAPSLPPHATQLLNEL